MTHSLDRRRFLKGAGVAIGLPILDSLTHATERAGAETPPAKPVKRVVCLSNNYGVYQKAFFPKEIGKDYTLPSTLASLEKHRNDFTVFSNLDHGISGGHACVPTFLNGIMPYLAGNFPEGNISLDQKAAEFVGAATRFPSLTLKVNDANLISFTRTGVQVPAIELRQTYRALFLDDDPKKKANARERFGRHRSLLDVVFDEAKSVNRRLGSRDRQKLEEYLNSVRSLEKKIVQQTPWIDRPKPKTDLPEPRPGQGTAKDLKAMIELVALALQTDSTRVVTLTSGFRGGDF
ncbi:MAG: DUF1552 domain-containing protein, partial [Planctomycetota bacterium]